MASRLKQFQMPLGVLSFLATIFFSGGLLVLLAVDRAFVRGEAGLSATVNFLLVSLIVGALTWPKLWRRREFQFSCLLALILVSFSLVLANIAALFFIPPWPARILHGKDPQVLQQAYFRASGEKLTPVPMNSWGELDDEHEIAANTKLRIALIGDSFLEMPFSGPLASELEPRVPTVEFLNLGVVGSAPDEYYYRARALAPKLGVRKVFFFVYAGNDFVGSRTLRTWYGIAAVSPRPSLLSLFGLSALNDAFTSRYRPFLYAWQGAFKLWDDEAKAYSEYVSARNPEELKKIVLGRVSDPARKEKLSEAWKKRDFKPLWEAIRNPDLGVFRTYFLGLAEGMNPAILRNFSNDTKLAEYFMKRVYKELAEQGIEATVVMIPDPFHVDPRMQKLWGILEDFTWIMQITRQRTQEMTASLRAEGVPVIDLYEALNGKAGAYQNFDGHWNPEGVKIVADYLAAKLVESENER